MHSPLKHVIVKHETKYSLKNQLRFNMATPKKEIVKK